MDSESYNKDCISAPLVRWEAEKYEAIQESIGWPNS